MVGRGLTDGGSVMRIKVLGEMLAGELSFASAFGVKKDEMRPKTDGAGSPKLSADGHPIFGVPGLDCQANGRRENNVTVGVLTPADVPAGRPVALSGAVWLTHYTTEAGRMGLSIVAERLVDAASVRPVSVDDLARQLASQKAS